MIGRHTHLFGFRFKPWIGNVEFVDEDVDESNGTVFDHRAIKTFWEQARLVTCQALNKSAHATP